MTMKEKLLEAIKDLEAKAIVAVSERSTQIDLDEMEVKIKAFILREYINETCI